MSKQIEDARFAFEGLGRQVDQVHRATLKLQNAFYATHIGGALLLAGSMTKLAKASAGLYKDKANIIEAQENLTVTSGLLSQTILANNIVLEKAGQLFQYLNDKKTDSNKHSMSLAMRFVTLGATLWTIISLVGAFTLAIGLLSLATQGAESPVVAMADGVFLLETAINGLVFAMSGEGEGGIFSGIIGTGALALVVLGLFGSTLAIITLALGLAGTAFHAVEQATGSFHGGMMAAIAVVSAFVAGAMLKFAALAPFFSFISVSIIGNINAIAARVGLVMARGQVIATATRAGFIAGFALIAAGLYGLVAYASGAMGTVEAIIVGVFSAIALGIGLFLIGVAAIPAAIIAAIAFILASVYRFWPEIKEGVSDFISWVMEKGSDFLSWIMTGGSDLWNWFTGGLSDLVSWAKEKTGDMAAWLSKTGSDIADFFLGIPGNIIDGITAGIDFIYQKFGDLMSWLGEQKDAITDMFDIDMPSIPGGGMVDTISSYNPFRAEGGPVTGGRPYIVGEKGPELFVPGSSGGIVPNNQLSSSSGGGGGPVTLNINVAGVTDRTDKRALAREIGDMLTQELRRQGGAPTRGRF